MMQDTMNTKKIVILSVLVIVIIVGGFLFFRYGNIVTIHQQGVQPLDSQSEAVIPDISPPDGWYFDRIGKSQIGLYQIRSSPSAGPQGIFITAEKMSKPLDEWIKERMSELFDIFSPDQKWSVINGNLVLGYVGREDLGTVFEYYIFHDSVTYSLTLNPYQKHIVDGSLQINEEGMKMLQLLVKDFALNYAGKLGPVAQSTHNLIDITQVATVIAIDSKKITLRGVDGLITDLTLNEQVGFYNEKGNKTPFSSFKLGEWVIAYGEVIHNGERVKILTPYWIAKIPAPMQNTN